MKYRYFPQADACSIVHNPAAVSHWSDSNMASLSTKCSTCCCVKHTGPKHQSQHTSAHTLSATLQVARVHTEGRAQHPCVCVCVYERVYQWPDSHTRQTRDWSSAAACHCALIFLPHSPVFLHQSSRIHLHPPPPVLHQHPAPPPTLGQLVKHVSQS